MLTNSTVARRAPKVADLHVLGDGAVRESAAVLIAQPQRARKAQQPRRGRRRRVLRCLLRPGLGFSWV